MNVTQLINSNGNPAANHIVITTEKGQYLKSYDSLVAFRPHDNLALKRLGSDWDYSATTLKHVKQFMGWPRSEKISRVDGRDCLLILRASSGINRSHFSHDYLSELLRLSLVSAVSAMDRYFHDAIVEKSWALLSSLSMPSMGA